MNFNFKEFKRFEKQIILKKIGIQGQKKIKKAKILIIGMGGLGCPLLTYLAASGIGHVGIVCLLYTSPSPRDKRQSRMPSSA